MANLEVMTGASAGMKLQIDGDRYLIGRSRNCNLLLQDDTISDEHAMIFFSPESGSFQLTNVEKSIVLLNGRQIINSKLKDGDIISFFDDRFQFRFNDDKDSSDRLKHLAKRAVGELADNIKDFSQKTYESYKERGTAGDTGNRFLPAKSSASAIRFIGAALFVILVLCLMGVSADSGALFELTLKIAQYSPYIIGFITSFLLFLIAELIDIFVAIENNTHKTNDLLTRLLEEKNGKDK